MTDAPPPSRRRGLPPLVTVLVVLVGLAIVVGGTGFYLFVQNFAIERRSAAAADAAFDQVRRQFPGQAPMVTVATDPGGRALRPTISREPGPQAGRKIDALHILAYNPRSGRLARITIPFWLIRLKGNAFSLDRYLDEVHADSQLTADDLQRHGPGIVLDFENRRGARVLVWVEGSDAPGPVNR
jgi:hypothetical protein